MMLASCLSDMRTVGNRLLAGVALASADQIEDFLIGQRRPPDYPVTVSAGPCPAPLAWWQARHWNWNCC